MDFDLLLSIYSFLICPRLISCQDYLCLVHSFSSLTLTMESGNDQISLRSIAISMCSIQKLHTA